MIDHWKIMRRAIELARERCLTPFAASDRGSKHWKKSSPRGWKQSSQFHHDLATGVRSTTNQRNGPGRFDWKATADYRPLYTTRPPPPPPPPEPPPHCVSARRAPIPLDRGKKKIPRNRQYYGSINSFTPTTWLETNRNLAQRGLPQRTPFSKCTLIERHT